MHTIYVKQDQFSKAFIKTLQSSIKYKIDFTLAETTTLPEKDKCIILTDHPDVIDPPRNHYYFDLHQLAEDPRQAVFDLLSFAPEIYIVDYVELKDILE